MYKVNIRIWNTNGTFRTSEIVVDTEQKAKEMCDRYNTYGYDVWYTLNE